MIYQVFCAPFGITVANVNLYGRYRIRIVDIWFIGNRDVNDEVAIIYSNIFNNIPINNLQNNGIIVGSNNRGALNIETETNIQGNMQFQALGTNGNNLVFNISGYIITLDIQPII